MKQKNEYEVLRDSLKDNALIILRNKIFSAVQEIADKYHLQYGFFYGGSVMYVKHLIHEKQSICFGIFDINNDCIGMSWRNIEFNVNLIDTDTFQEIKENIESKFVLLTQIISMKIEKENKEKENNNE